MRHLLLRRLAASALLAYLVLTFTFFFIHLAPGEPSILFSDPRINNEKRQAIREAYGLDRPLVEQYWRWMGSVSRGNWGLSLQNGRPALDIVLDKLLNTALLVAAISLVEYGFGLAFGMFAAVRAGTLPDHLIRTVFLVLYAVPVFWLALVAMQLFSVRWSLFPIGQMTSHRFASMSPWQQFLDIAHHMVLPAVTLGLARSGAVVRYVRNGLLEVQRMDFIRTAYGKGLSARRVLWVHALRHALLPLAQRLGTSLPILLSGSLIIEAIFSWPGIGYQAYLAILQRDYPVILASTAVLGLTVVLGSLLADLLMMWLDPRVRHATA